MTVAVKCGEITADVVPLIKKYFCSKEALAYFMLGSQNPVPLNNVPHQLSSYYLSAVFCEGHYATMEIGRDISVYTYDGALLHKKNVMKVWVFRYNV